MDASSAEKWSKCIKMLPRITTKLIANYFSSQCTSARHFNRSELFLQEHYVTNIETLHLPCEGKLRVRGKCHRSFKKNEEPHSIQLIFSDTLSVSTPSENVIQKAICSCTVGQPGYCNHVIAALKLLRRFQKDGFTEIPPELSCTSQAQQWGRFRTKNEFVFRLTDGSHGKCLLYQPCKRPRLDVAQENAVIELAKSVASSNEEFAEQLLSGATLSASGHELTRLGEVPKSATLAYQLNTNNSEYDVETNIHQAVSITVRTLPRNSWNGFEMNVPGRSLYHVKTPSEATLLNKLKVDLEKSRFIEKNSRSQAESTLWRQERAFRVTASTFGTIVKRSSAWTLPGLRNVLAEKNLSGLRQVSHGRKFESIAAARYQATMHRLGRQVTLDFCGLVVDPKRYWLAASPDRRVFDPFESPPHGLLEVKCPHSSRNKPAKDCLSDPNFYVKLVDDVPRLDRSHEYYFQVMGQMAITGAKWCDFVVFTFKGLIIERITFDPLKWDQMSSKLDAFYFTEALPYFAGTNVLKPSLKCN